ncbi:AAA family ATPase [Acinetobacter pittii]|uniref:AAA family ATPase n=1 Tax=Acinetobacter pittii TaxID=48296 RepID=UPI00300D1AD3
MRFQIINRNVWPPKTGVNIAYLQINNWNDFSYETTFNFYLHDEKGQYHELGPVKIGFKGQTTQISTYSSLPTNFVDLPDHYFSLGQEIEYYEKLSTLSEDTRKTILISLNDIVHYPTYIDIYEDEEVLSRSLLRDISLSIIKGQYSRVLNGCPPLTEFEFKFKRKGESLYDDLELNFDVIPNSQPSTNIHAIIGRNGVGKTTLLNQMISAVISRTDNSIFLDTSYRIEKIISKDYFSSLVSVSFSAFDPFHPLSEQHDPSKGTCYFYVGLKKIQEIDTLKTIADLHIEFSTTLSRILMNTGKKARWINAIKTLESDENFELINLTQLAENYNEKSAIELISRMSSGHAIVLLTITKLVSTVDEKTLVIIDEPESHLHPPLLSAFIRALSELLYNRNGVAIIATHSPVVLQEIPKSCVWKINRIGNTTSCFRPEIETFGENVGILTREVFGLEVIKSGFHYLLKQSVESDKNFQEIIEEYDDQLGLEARTILKAMINERDREL